MIVNTIGKLIAAWALWDAWKRRNDPPSIWQFLNWAYAEGLRQQDTFDRLMAHNIYGFSAMKLTWEPRES